MAKGAEEPQAINLDRSAERRHIEVVHAVHGVGCPEPTIYQFGRQRGGLERTVARREEQVALEGVAAVSRDQGILATSQMGTHPRPCCFIECGPTVLPMMVRSQFENSACVYRGWPL